MPRLRFASLGSGSRGNATLVQAAETLLLVDCGFPARELERRCQGLGIDPGEIDGVLVTHEHGDHLRGVGPVARRYGMPVWMTHGTHRAGRCGALPEVRLFNSHDGGIGIGALRVTPFAVPHDAREPCQFVFAHRGLRLGLLTDTGSLTPRARGVLDGVDALLLECNHDPGMLASGPYPPALQARVGGDYGHLANAQAAALLAQIDHPRLQHLVAGHLSEKNNRPELAVAALLGVDAGLESRLRVLAQARTSGWFELA